MNVRSLALALAAGIAAFLVVGVAVTELAQPWIEFSLFLGIPAGLAAGALAAAAVYLGLAGDAPVGRRRVAGAFGGFGAGFLVVLVVLGGVLDLGTTLALVLAAAVGLLVAVAAYVRGRNEPGAGDGGPVTGPR